MKTQKINPAIGRLLVGVGWPPRTQPNLWQKITHTAPGSVTPRDLDLFCEILHSSGSVQEIIDAGNSRSDTGAVVHLQDNLSGQGEGDDEQMVLDLDLLPNSINKLRFCVRLASGSEEKNIPLHCHLWDPTQTAAPVMNWLCAIPASSNAAILFEIERASDGAWQVHNFTVPASS